MPLFQEATERKILVEMLKESIKPAPDIITNPDEIPCTQMQICLKMNALHDKMFKGGKFTYFFALFVM